MIGRFAVALLVKRNKEWLMPLSIVICLTFFLLSEFSALQFMRRQVDAFCLEIEEVDLWITDDRLVNEDLGKIKRLSEISMASFIYKGAVEAYAPYGEKRSCMLLGVDETTHLGLPSKVMYGSLRLRGGDDTAILSHECAKSLFKWGQQRLKFGSALYLDDHLVKVGGVVSVNRTPIIYTNFIKAKEMKEGGETWMVIKTHLHTSLPALQAKIEKSIGLKALTTKQLSDLLFRNYLKDNQQAHLVLVMIVFGAFVSFALFFTALYFFFRGQVRHYSILRSIGASPFLITGLLVMQSLLITLFGFAVAFCLYMVLQIVCSPSEWFFPLSFCGAAIICGLLIVMSLVASMLVSFKVKESV